MKFIYILLIFSFSSIAGLAGDIREDEKQIIMDISSDELSNVKFVSSKVKIIVGKIKKEYIKRLKKFISNTNKNGPRDKKYNMAIRNINYSISKLN